jgi:hypothetical protein
VAVGGLRGPTLVETALRVFCATAILDRYAPGETLTYADLVMLAADLELPVTPDRLVAAALASGVVARDESGGLRVGIDIGLGQVFSELHGRRGARVEVEEYKRILSGAPQTAGAASGAASPDSCIGAIGRAHAWTNETLSYMIDHKLEGVPCFWQCEANTHTPLFATPGTSTTMVHLWAWLHSRGFEVGVISGREANVVRLCESVLKLQRVGRGWERGAFSVWGPDDDFSGSFQEGPDIPEGPCPTLDGTAGAVEVLATVLSMPDVRRYLPEPMEASTRMSIAAAADFVLRAQLDDGAWGIYRYESDRHEVVPREISSCLAVQALASAVRSASLESSLISRVHRALHSYMSWIEKQVKGDNEVRWWLPDFTARISNEAERRLATAWVCRSFLAMNGLELDETLRRRIQAMLLVAVRFVTDDWAAVADASAPVEFRVPRWHGGLSSGTVTWHLPRDPLIASTVLDYLVHTGEPCPEHWWVTINEAIANVIRTQEHGHWAHYLQRLEGRRYASPGFTKYCIEFLLKFLEYLSSRTKDRGIAHAS